MFGGHVGMKSEITFTVVTRVLSLVISYESPKTNASHSAFSKDNIAVASSFFYHAQLH